MVRQDVQDGALYLTIVYDGAAPDTLARVNLSGSADGVKVTEYMLGTDQGKEIYGDLVNTAGTLEVTPEPDQQATVTVKNGEETVATTQVTVGETYTLPCRPHPPRLCIPGLDEQRGQPAVSGWRLCHHRRGHHLHSAMGTCVPARPRSHPQP